MSRITVYQDNQLEVVMGTDHTVGHFIQIYDSEMVNETPEGEGLIYDWSEMFDVQTNYTGIPSSTPPEVLVNEYLAEHVKEKDIVVMPISLN